MASLMEDLIDVLNKEEEQYQGLIELGKKKREVVIRADIKTLDEITATEQEVASNLQIWRRREPEYSTTWQRFLAGIREMLRSQR